MCVRVCDTYVYVIRMCVHACMFGIKLLTKGILWSHYSIIKATPTTYIGAWPPQRAIASYSTAFVLTPLPYYDCFMLARSAFSQPCSQQHVYRQLCDGG